jgi:hypothetical protein
MASNTPRIDEVAQTMQEIKGVQYTTTLGHICNVLGPLNFILANAKEPTFAIAAKTAIHSMRLLIQNPCHVEERDVSTMLRAALADSKEIRTRALRSKQDKRP